MDEHVLSTYQRAEEVYVSGRGAWLVDAQGREHLDFLSGIGVSALGHAHPRLVAELTDQLGRLAHVSNLLRHEHTEALAAELCALTGMDGAFFCNSGTEANEAALKIARKHQRARGAPQRVAFVALEGGFHGRSLGALSITAKEAYRAPFAPLLEARFVPPEDVPALEEALAAGPAALVLEPLQGEGGLTRLSAEYLRAARALCDRTQTVLVHDEVQCGSGRSGRFLCAQHAGVVPDVVTLAKPLAGGLPMGAALARGELARALAPGDHGTTFGGGPLACRAARVFLSELAGGLQEAVVARGRELEAGLDALVADSPHASERRGIGLMQGLVVPGRCAELHALLHQRGLLASRASGDVLRLLPPYVITSEDLRRALELLRDALADLPPATNG